VRRVLPGILFGLAGIFSTPLAWPLDSVFSRGDSCIGIAWTPDSSNTKPAWYLKNGSGCSGVDTIYRHCDFITGRTYNGVAYSYGGEDPWYRFRERLAKGFLVGSHLCHYNAFGDPRAVVTGTDCSAFLCFIWNVGRISTSTMVASPAYEHIARSTIQPGDALVRSGYHAVFVVEADDLTEALIWEASSSVFGCRARLTDLTASAWNLYTPLRNPQIETNTRIEQGGEGEGVLQPVILMQVAGTLLFRSSTRPMQSIEFFDPAGRRVIDVENRAGALEQTITMDECAPGVYTVVVRFQDSSLFAKRILIRFQ
jgi:hypothetical protein